VIGTSGSSCVASLKVVFVVEYEAMMRAREEEKKRKERKRKERQQRHREDGRSDAEVRSVPSASVAPKGSLQRLCLVSDQVGDFLIQHSQG